VTSSKGVELWLPVEVDGALFSVGDTHCRARRRRGLRHGDREPPSTVALKLDLVKGRQPPHARAT